MENERILIFGAAGSIGSELYRQLVEKNQVTAFDNNETALFDLHEEHAQKGYDVRFWLGDVRDKHSVSSCYDSVRPTVVFHAAALKHVYPNELFPEEAVNTNVKGTINVLRGATRAGVRRLIYISTDKVINSNSVMGVTKRLGELFTKQAGYTAVRFGNVLGSRGSLIPIWERQMSKGEPLTVTDARAERYFMTIEEACALVIQAAALDAKGKVVVMEMGERKNILAFAKEILGKAGKDEANIKMIGLRQGETLSEEVMTLAERESAVRVGDFYILT